MHHETMFQGKRWHLELRVIGSILEQEILGLEIPGVRDGERRCGLDRCKERRFCHTRSRELLLRVVLSVVLYPFLNEKTRDQPSALSITLTRGSANASEPPTNYSPEGVDVVSEPYHPTDKHYLFFCSLRDTRIRSRDPPTDTPVADIVLVVAVRDRRQYLGHQRHRVALAVPPLLRLALLEYALEQLAPRAQLGHLCVLYHLVLSRRYETDSRNTSSRARKTGAVS